MNVILTHRELTSMQLLLPNLKLSILLHNVNVKYVHIIRRNKVLGSVLNVFLSNGDPVVSFDEVNF
jgi:hypothetical protein